MPQRPLAGPPFCGAEELAIGERRQAIDAQFGFQNDAGTVAAIAPVGPAPGHEFFSAHAAAAITAFAGLEFDLDAVDKHDSTIGKTDGRDDTGGGWHRWSARKKHRRRKKNGWPAFESAAEIDWVTRPNSLPV